MSRAREFVVVGALILSFVAIIFWLSYFHAGSQVPDKESSVLRGEVVSVGMLEGAKGQRGLLVQVSVDGQTVSIELPKGISVGEGDELYLSKSASPGKNSYVYSGKVDNP